MALPDNTLPPNPRNDAAAILHAGSTSRIDSVECESVAGRPTRPLKTLQIAMVLCTVSGLVFLVSRNEAFLVAGVVGYLSSVVALSAGIRIAWRRLKGRRNELIPQAHRGLKWSALAMILFVVSSWGCLLCNQRMRDHTIAVVSCANLRGVGQAVFMYLEKYGQSPVTLDNLATTEFCSPKQVVSPFDRIGTPISGPNCSYIFVSGAAFDSKDPSRILAYERVPRCPKGLRLFPERFHAVLYCDGHVETLSASELAAGLAANPTTRP